MKIKFQNLIFLFWAFIVFQSPAVVQAAETETEVITSGDFQYTKSLRTDAVTIVGYIGTEEKIVVPAYIDGKKVCAVDFKGEYYKINNVIKEIEISFGINSIDGFSICSKLEKVTIPESVTIIKKEAFSGCDSMTEIYIPDSVMMIEEDAFFGCSNLREIRLPARLTEIHEGTFCFCEKLEKIDIPNSVTRIGNSAFEACYSLKEVVIPDSVTEMEEYAFVGCCKLSKVKLSKNIKAIRRATFFGCNLKTINIPKSVTIIGKNAFLAVPLTKIELSSKVKYIGPYAFGGCKKLKNITFKGKNPPQIKKGAFQGINKKAVFNVPNKSISKYRKILKNKKIYDGKQLKIK